MTILDWVIVIGSGLTILLLILSAVSLTRMIKMTKQLKEVAKDRPHTKRDKKKWRRKKKLMSKAKSQRSKQALIFLVLMLFCFGGTGYAHFYQTTNMNEVDTENIVSSYYLIEQLTEQFSSINKEGTSDKKATENIHVLAVRMASFSSKKGNDHGSKESQLYLNRYYAKVGQLGVNIAAQDYTGLKESKELQNDYLKDLEKIKSAQKIVLDYYKIDESSLKEKQ